MDYFNHAITVGETIADLSLVNLIKLFHACCLSGSNEKLSVTIHPIKKS
jgi:hypothetical protein